MSQAYRSDGSEEQGLVLGPDEIVNYPLRKATRGYAVDEVDDLLDQLAVQTQTLLRQISRLELELGDLREELGEASETETTLKRTLVTAQKAAEASVAEARQEADELRQQAREQVEELLRGAADQAEELRQAILRRARAEEGDLRRHRRDVEEHIQALHTFASDHRARIAHHLRLQLERLDEMELPPPPPEPTMEPDEVLSADVDDVATILAELAGPGDPAEADDDAEVGDEDDSEDASGDDSEDDSEDVDATADATDDDDPGAVERLFDS